MEGLEKEEYFFLQYFDEINNLEAFTRVAYAGFRFVSETISLVDSTSIKNIEYGAEGIIQGVKPFLENEIKNNYTYLYNLSSIRIWGIIETAVDDFVQHIIETDINVRNLETLKRIQGPLVDFINMSHSDQSLFLLDSLKQSIKANLKLGVGRFESILSSINHDGVVHELVRTTLFELSQIRNVLVHKNGKADLRIIKNCPWLELSQGMALQITEKKFNKYKLAVMWYILELTNRRSIFTFDEKDEELIKLQENIISKLEKD
ncbi:hypothetical protein [Paenibacillus harenae]|uniref:Apea-like HEPN domain-containing protein n=1 Tax=Paenibacillus harenae TaxID=306543 RepID=A0ABT9TYK5_PAEHA|nr:hypothetical protein [Paenibacillus harenae]MDQ0112459.1 hypothetical protein [Paenibacillus harenae]